jgi:restriction endonuclease S subunit
MIDVIENLRIFYKKVKKFCFVVGFFFKIIKKIPHYYYYYYFFKKNLN